MIWYDNLRSFKSCSYYVQQLYSIYKGTNVLPLKMNGKVVAGDEDQNGLFASSVLDKNTGDIYVKVVNVSDKAQDVKVTLKGLKGVTSAKMVSLSSSDPIAENTLDNPNKIKPVEQTVQMTGKNVLETKVPASTFAIYVISK